MQSYDNLFEEATNIIVLGGSKIYWLTSFGNNYVCIQKHFILKKIKDVLTQFDYLCSIAPLLVTRMKRACKSLQNSEEELNKILTPLPGIYVLNFCHLP